MNPNIRASLSSSSSHTLPVNAVVYEERLIKGKTKYVSYVLHLSSQILFGRHDACGLLIVCLGRSWESHILRKRSFWYSVSIFHLERSSWSMKQIRSLRSFAIVSTIHHICLHSDSTTQVDWMWQTRCTKHRDQQMCVLSKQNSIYRSLNLATHSRRISDVIWHIICIYHSR